MENEQVDGDAIKNSIIMILHEFELHLRENQHCDYTVVPNSDGINRAIYNLLEEMGI